MFYVSIYRRVYEAACAALYLRYFTSNSASSYHDKFSWKPPTILFITLLVDRARLHIRLKRICKNRCQYKQTHIDKNKR